MSIKYIIADDHKIFREGLKLVLSSDPELELLYEANNGVELLEQLVTTTTKPDIILLDLKMPEMDGVEAATRIVALYPDIRIIILTMNDDEQLIIHLLEAGAKGYLIKNTDADEIKLALHACYQNGYYFSDHVSTVMLKSIMQKSNASPTFNDPKKIVLTERELEVLQMICEGMTASEIGKKIFLSHRTVEGIKATLLEKTNARNTAALIMFAIKNNYC